ncbi:hypothetical protein [Pseudomonas aeruginosa]|uniref:hypothetical protein n=1 Tax=Pseudomonas aeruginosa TaxID=287 RepID=UPI0015C5BA09|nr:hypothetical protein [Pseudomonas aeruginosa]HBO3240120.1 hypothetical protein [Pseudomonas aeruginosa]
MSKELNKAPVEQAGGDERDLQGAQGDSMRLYAVACNGELWRGFPPSPERGLIEKQVRGWQKHRADLEWSVIEFVPAALAQPSPVQELDFSKPLETENGDPVKWICADVIEYKSARICVAQDTGLVYSSPYIGLKIRNVIPEQAEAERPEFDESEREDMARIAFETAMANGISLDSFTFLSNSLAERYERIVGELRAVIAQLRQHKNDYMDSGQETYRALLNEIREREAEIARLDGLVSGRTAERDAALARVAELEKQEPVATVARVPGEDWNGLHFYRDLQGMQPGTKLYAAPVAQAQHSVPDELRAICMLVAETGIKYGRGRHRAVAADECRAVVNAVLNADLSVGRACEYAGCCDKAHPGTSLCIAHHSKKAREQLLAAAPGKEGV